MKKILKTILFTAISILSVCAFASCKDKNNNHSFSEANSVDENTTKQLATPTNIYVENFILHWDSVANATGYSINVEKTDDVYVDETRSTQYDIRELVKSHETCTVYLSARDNTSEYNHSEWAEFVFTAEEKASFTYVLNSDGASYTLKSCTNFDGKVVIPDTYQGKPVTRIDDNAFGNNTSVVGGGVGGIIVFHSREGVEKLNEVVLPLTIQSIDGLSYCEYLERVELQEGIKCISFAAFAGCINLKEINIPESVTEIKKSAFRDCNQLNIIGTMKNVEEVGANALEDTLWYRLQPYGMIYVGKVMYRYKSDPSQQNIVVNNLRTDVVWSDQVFYGCENVAKVIVPDGITVIPFSFFEGCLNLKEIILPNGLQEIKASAFKNCVELKEIAIPNSVQTIGRSVFHGAGLTSVTLPQGLTEIPERLFYGCKNLKTYTVPDGIQTIGASAFKECSSLTEIILPVSLQKINSGVFENCTALKEVYFEGTQEEWETIEIGLWNDVLKNVTVIFEYSTNNEAKT